MFDIYLVTRNSLTTKDGIEAKKVATVFNLRVAEHVGKFLLKTYPGYSDVEVMNEDNKVVFSTNCTE